MGSAHRGLEARQGGDYGPVAELDKAPTLITSSVQTPSSTTPYLSLTELLNHKSKTSTIRPKTVTTVRGYLEKFIAFIGHDDAARVTKADVRRWRDSLMEQSAPKLLPKTIDDSYISAVKSVLAHGVKEFDLPSNAASNIRDTRPSPAPTRSKGWSLQEAAQILQATFDGSSKALSTPHKRALFWVPWILAYTGLRASEVTQFRGRHLSTDGGAPHLIISPLDGNTKSGKAWAVGIHEHLIELGFLDFVKQIGDGPLFYEAYEDGTDLTKLDGRHRAKDAAERVSEWVREEVKLVAPLGRANHAWRHLFTTRSRDCQMDKEARDYMMGSRNLADAREGYGDWPPAVLDREINKLPRFEVEETGWRP
jgi:integrase